MGFQDWKSCETENLMFSILDKMAIGNAGSGCVSCAKCRRSFPPKHFDYKLLAELEADGEAYLAECLQCNDTLGTKERHQKDDMECNKCQVRKPRSEYRIERQRCNNYKTWRCRSCEFPPCDRCGKIPTEIKPSGYRCKLCMWPPCACGKERPRSTKYSTKTMKTEWKCNVCRSTR